MLAPRAKHLLPRLIAIAFGIVLGTPVAAKDPYKAKDVRAVLAHDIGVEAAQIKSAKAARCAVVDPKDLYYEYGRISAQYSDCLVAQFTDAIRFFYYYEKKYNHDVGEDGWKEMFFSKPQVVRGAKVAEVKSLGAMLRQIQLDLEGGLIIVINYSGGILGDNKYPLEAIRQLANMGLPTFAGVDYVDPIVHTPKTITIYY